MRPFVLGSAAVGAVLVAAAGLVTLRHSLEPPPAQDIGVAVVVTPLPLDHDGYQPIPGLCLPPQECSDASGNCSVDEDPWSWAS